MLDMSTLKLKDQYPACPICPKEPVCAMSCWILPFWKNKAITLRIFTLPGNATEKDRKDVYQKGVCFNIAFALFAKDFHKKKTRAEQQSFLIKTKPIITKLRHNPFYPCISIGVKSCIIITPSKKERPKKAYFMSALVSPTRNPISFCNGQAKFSNSFNSSTSGTIVDPRSLDEP